VALPRIPGEGPRDLSQPLEVVRVRVDERQAGLRLDQALQFFLHWRSRTSIHRLIKGGYVELEGRSATNSRRVLQGEIITIRIPDPPRADEMVPDDSDVRLVFEDEWMVAVDKPPGMAVHPAGRRVGGTLIHLLHERYRRPDDPRHDVVPRLLHRIDVDTSGVVAVGLDERFHSVVARQFEDREVQKTYLAVVHGGPPQDEGVVDFSIGPDKRSPVRLKLRAFDDGTGQPALTEYTVRDRGRRYSLVELRPKTGRTHQIRVHMDAIGCPLVGDKIYGGNEDIFLEKLGGELSAASLERLVLDRHALHSHRLRFFHPHRGESMELEAPLPADMAGLLADG